ncbi:hypothetical protein PFISCL1PPCAC_20423, partial [Pristionchus fissidentatus]
RCTMAGRDQLQKWMGQVMEMELTDGRLVTGQMMATDNTPNIVMSQCVERWPEDNNGSSRFIGLVMVAPKNMRRLTHIVRTPVAPSTKDE